METARAGMVKRVQAFCSFFASASDFNRILERLACDSIYILLASNIASVFIASIQAIHWWSEQKLTHSQPEACRDVIVGLHS